MYFDVSAKALATGRDKAGAAAQAGRLGKALNAVSARRKGLPEGPGVHGAVDCGARLGLGSTQAGATHLATPPWTPGASHIKVHGNLKGRAFRGC